MGSSRRTTVVALLALLGIACPVLADKRGDDDLIGWSESYTHSPPLRGNLRVLSWDPRIFVLEGVLSDQECDHLIALATPRLERSGVVEVEGHGKDAVNDVRTSYGMFFDRFEDPVVRAIEERLSGHLMLPSGHGEGIQVLRYQNGQEYKPHFDYFFHEGGIDNGGNRLATTLMYLADVEEGGETVFPNVPVPPTQTREAGFTECAMKGLAYRPKKGDAVVFWSLRPDGTLDKGSVHGSCPVVRGTKWAATKWYHVAHFAMGGEAAHAVHHKVFVPPPPPAPTGMMCSFSDVHLSFIFLSRAKIYDRLDNHPVADYVAVQGARI